ncbi:hypothetical protein [Carboxylicivirga marina]|uniref:Uncharacterized protein n=1 Tax=Carboxylicivirga marina TaxID=2800988 RepID=A0ABS1HIK7_9BACT|nr:hypothetical protein [Carboxylicivirga marina]MBK3517503.1 hypothetical protein [Carboxylicivirga marina]
MKNLLMLALLFICIAANAQNKEPYVKVAEKNLKTWVEVCDLDDQQQKDLLVVVTKKQKELHTIKFENKDNKEQAKALGKEVTKKYSKEIKDIVGAENIQKMNAYYRKANKK